MGAELADVPVQPRPSASLSAWLSPRNPTCSTLMSLPVSVSYIRVWYYCTVVKAFYSTSTQY